LRTGPGIHDHEKLLQDLADIGISGRALDWFVSYLSGREQIVKVGSLLSARNKCGRGVPQGSVLGPLLFVIYIRNVPSLFKHSLSQLFADDIAFYISGRDCHSIIRLLQDDLASLDAYLQEKGLILNPTKTQFLIIRKPNVVLEENTVLTCRDSSLAPASSAKYLGIIIDEHLCFNLQVHHVIKSVHQKTGAFKLARNDLTHHAKRVFYLSVIQSTFDYASCSYTHCLTKHVYLASIALLQLQLF